MFRRVAICALVALACGVLAGSAFLYELRRRRKKSAKSQAQPDARGDRRKERLSPMVQAVVTVRRHRELVGRKYVVGLRDAVGVTWNPQLVHASSLANSRLWM